MTIYRLTICEAISRTVLKELYYSSKQKAEAAAKLKKRTVAESLAGMNVKIATYINKIKVDNDKD